MTLSDALKVEWDATRSVLVTFWRSDGVRYTFGATSSSWTLSNPVAGRSSGASSAKLDGRSRLLHSRGHGERDSAYTYYFGTQVQKYVDLGC